jgi:hypothetical protein
MAMRNPHVPFAWVDGQAYLIVNYELEPRGDLPPLRDLLKGLLAHHDPADVLLLRPLSRAEARLLRQSTEGAAVEAWAQIAASMERRLGSGRPQRAPARRRPKAQRAPARR